MRVTLFIRQKKIVRELPRTSPVDYIRIKVFQSTMTPKLKLYYFNSKGKGEPIRLFCAYAGLDLEEVVRSRTFGRTGPARLTALPAIPT